MTTVQGTKNRKYEVRSQLYGTQNLVQRLYFGGIFLAATSERGPHDESSSSMEITIERANERADKLGIEITE